MMRRLQCHQQMVRYYLFNSILIVIYLLIPEGVPPPANGTEVYMLLYNLITDSRSVGCIGGAQRAP